MRCCHQPPPECAGRMREAPPTMKRIGLLGGMSWESSAEYYRLINEATRDRLGGLHSADCLLRSVDFAEVERLQRTGDWDQAGAAARRRGQRAGGGRGRTAGAVHEHDAQGRRRDHRRDRDPVRPHRRHHRPSRPRRGLTTVGLLATAYTMEQDFYVGRLRDLHGLDVLVPDEPDRRIVHEVIYEELCVGVIADDSRTKYRRIIADLADRGADGILLGCTEIDLLVGPAGRAGPGLRHHPVTRTPRGRPCARARTGLMPRVAAAARAW